MSKAKKKSGERRCRVCNCSDDDCSQCIEKTGEPCRWVDPDLCSACAGDIAEAILVPRRKKKSPTKEAK